jgi:hypothetical protein
VELYQELELLALTEYLVKVQTPEDLDLPMHKQEALLELAE